MSESRPLSSPAASAHKPGRIPPASRFPCRSQKAQTICWRSAHPCERLRKILFLARHRAHEGLAGDLESLPGGEYSQAWEQHLTDVRWEKSLALLYGLPERAISIMFHMQAYW